jgi:WD40-like Beta Propeller Repeat
MKTKLSMLPLVALLVMPNSGASAAVVRTVRINVASSGEQANPSGEPFGRAPAISAHGRWVAFASAATNLVEGDANSHRDVFVHDLRTGRTELVSVSTSGAQGNGRSESPSISGDGRWVAFDSTASNLVAGDDNDSSDVFVHNMKTGRTKLVSVSNSGTPGNKRSDWPSISASGRLVAFETKATNLVAGDTNSFQDVVVHDLRKGTNTLASANSLSEQANNWSGGPAIDGSRITFSSRANNLALNDDKTNQDVFVHDLRTGNTSLVSVSTSGASGDWASWSSSISGHLVAFTSLSSNLVQEDLNGRFDAFVRNIHTGKTRLVSLSTTGEQGSDDSIAPMIGGHRVTFFSLAKNLVPTSDDSLVSYEVFVRNLRTQTTGLASVGLGGEPANGRSLWPTISADGMIVAFQSEASNLVPNDTNGAPDIFVRGRLPHP